MRWEDVVALAARWPEVRQATSYGEPSLMVRKRLLTRWRVADDTIVLLGVPADERDLLIEMAPDVFFCEPHYDSHDAVLACLSAASPDDVAGILERRWRSSATRKAIAAFDAFL